MKFTLRKPKVRPGCVDPLKDVAKEPAKKAARAKELGGPGGPEPTRYGDWERKGICIDF